MPKLIPPGRYLALFCLTLCFMLLYQLARTNQVRHKSWLKVKQVETTVAINYLAEIKPVLAERCYSCHGESQRRGGLRLDTVAGMLEGGDNGPAIKPGQAASSLLVAVLRGDADVPPMPPQGTPLTEKQVSQLERWINEGAQGPANEKMTNLALQHWSFTPIKRPAIPEVRQQAWVRNPIDAFVISKLEDKGLEPNPPVNKELLLRRVYLDLIGLPPTPEQLRAFVQNTAPDAYEKIVDSLLTSPLHAERWARHWMDVWRYSDPDGRKAKNDTYWSNEFVWRWRDWIIRSLQEDRGYDQMVLEMLAGDELAPNDTQALEGTGFLARNFFKLSRNVWLSNTIEHTGKAFLGLTMNCARCHDHRTDPISQKDYYRFRAIFEPHDIRTDSASLEGKTDKIGLARAFDVDIHRPTYLFRRGDEMNPDTSVAMAPAALPFLGGALEIVPLKRVHPRQEPGKPAQFEVYSSGRRLALARWLIDPHNPLTSRVAINQIWTHHFGVGFVETPSDLGLRCKPPVLVELLDYLASELQSNGWSMKQIHRLIVTSNLYRMQSIDNGSQAHSIDPDNQYWWRFPSHRMEAEVVRDSLLHLAGNLDLTQGGPPLPISEEGGRQRRSLYFRYSREDKMEFLDTFDAARVEECYRREVSVVPQQSLALLNSPFAWNQAQAIARRLESRDPASFVNAAFAALLCRSPTTEEMDACLQFLVSQETLLRDPKQLTPFPGATSSAPPEPSQGARDSLIHVLINHNDFVTIR